MKTVKCKSGAIGWQSRLQKVYTDFEEFEEYDRNYGVAKRLGFKSAESAWKKNPTVQGSTNPSDFRKVRVK